MGYDFEAYLVRIFGAIGVSFLAGTPAGTACFAFGVWSAGLSIVMALASLVERK